MYACLEFRFWIKTMQLALIAIFRVLSYCNNKTNWFFLNAGYLICLVGWVNARKKSARWSATRSIKWLILLIRLYGILGQDWGGRGQFLMQKEEGDQSRTWRLRRMSSPYPIIMYDSATPLCYISTFLCDLADLLTCPVFQRLPQTLNMFLLSDKPSSGPNSAKL